MRRVEEAVARIALKYPDFVGALIDLNKDGEVGAACFGLQSFPHFVANSEGAV